MYTANFSLSNNTTCSGLPLPLIIIKNSLNIRSIRITSIVSVGHLFSSCPKLIRGRRLYIWQHIATIGQSWRMIFEEMSQLSTKTFLPRSTKKTDALSGSFRGSLSFTTAQHQESASYLDIKFNDKKYIVIRTNIMAIYLRLDLLKSTAQNKTRRKKEKKIMWKNREEEK